MVIININRRNFKWSIEFELNLFIYCLKFLFLKIYCVVSMDQLINYVECNVIIKWLINYKTKQTRFKIIWITKIWIINDGWLALNILDQCFYMKHDTLFFFWHTQIIWWSMMLLVLKQTRTFCGHHNLHNNHNVNHYLHKQHNNNLTPTSRWKPPRRDNCQHLIARKMLGMACNSYIFSKIPIHCESELACAHSSKLEFINIKSIYQTM